MKLFLSSLAIFVLFFVPVNAQIGDVVINEIAWMGTENSASDEWLELYNFTVGDIDLTNWTLEAADGSPKITLTGAITAGGYFLLERVDDTTVPSIPANQIYTGALSNSGEVLVLKNAQGAEVDRVTGSNSWESVGGDNATKETAQKTANGWVTATSTPKAVNTQSQAAPEETVVVEENTNPSSEGSKFQPPKANAGENIIAEVGQNIFFDASLSQGDNLSFSWNMGNGEIKEGKDFLYSYDFPGRYIVTLFVDDTNNKSQSQIQVTIYQSGIFISEFFSGGVTESGWIELYNDSNNYVNTSSWSFSNGKDLFKIPNETFIAGKDYLVFSESVLGNNFVKQEGKLILLYPNGQTADKVAYTFENSSFSASRKNENEFVLTKNKTPGFSNVTTYFDDNAINNASEAGVSLNTGVSKNLISENFASFVKVNGQKSFLIEPAYAMLSQDEAGFLNDRNNNLNLSANLSSLISFNVVFYVFFATLALLGGFYLWKRKLKKNN